MSSASSLRSVSSGAEAWRPRSKAAQKAASVRPIVVAHPKLPSAAPVPVWGPPLLPRPRAAASTCTVAAARPRALSCPGRSWNPPTEVLDPWVLQEWDASLTVMRHMLKEDPANQQEAEKLLLDLIFFATFALDELAVPIPGLEP
jgi:hypothetical protein